MRRTAVPALGMLLASMLVAPPAGAVQGVDDAAVTVVLYNDFDVSGDLTLPWSESDEPFTPTDTNDDNIVRTMKALLRYHAQRTETYGRVVHVTAVPSARGMATTCEQRRADAFAVALDHHPFAVVPLGNGNMACFIEALATEFQIPTFGSPRNLPRSTFVDHAPYIWSFMPDQETQTSLSAGYICRALAGGTARFTADADLLGRPRTFGIIYPRESSGGWTRGPETARQAELLIAETETRCGLEWGTQGGIARYLDGGSQGLIEAPSIMHTFKSAKVTTLICYCPPTNTEFTLLKMQAAATGLNYRPEFFFDHVNSMDKAIWHQRGSTRITHAAFGVSPLWRMPNLEDQDWYNAYESQEPGTTPNLRHGFDIYWSYWTLFIAIQAAGADLTLENAAAGLHGIAYRDLEMPFAPSGGFESTKANPFSFIDSGMAWWYDPFGTPPGGLPNEGCLRAVDGGLRHYSDTWPTDDAAQFSTAPCTSPPYRFVI